MQACVTARQEAASREVAERREGKEQTFCEVRKALTCQTKVWSKGSLVKITFICTILNYPHFKTKTLWKWPTGHWH